MTAHHLTKKLEDKNPAEKSKYHLIPQEEAWQVKIGNYVFLLTGQVKEPFLKEYFICTLKTEEQPITKKN
jgi:hypothetical protein